MDNREKTTKGLINEDFFASGNPKKCVMFNAGLNEYKIIVN